MSDRMNENLANLVATIESVAAGDIFDEENADHELVTAEMLEGTVLHLSNGQSINVVQMTGSLEDAINVVQVETTELGDHVSTMEGMCAIDIDTEERKHILSETGAHVVVKTEDEVVDTFQTEEPTGGGKKPPVVLPTIPFSFPGQSFDIKCQKLILNVWDFFRRLKKNPDILDEIRTPQERAAAALHISAATIGKIGKKFSKTGKLEMPGKKRNRAKPVVDSVKPEHEQVIRNIIKEVKDSGSAPTLPYLLNECRERLNFQGGATSFRRILHRMGYKGLSQSIKSGNQAAVSSSSHQIKPSPSKVSIQPQPKPTPSQSISLREISKPIEIENGFLSIPISTPNSSPVKKAPSRTFVSSPSPSKSKKTQAPVAVSGNESIQLTPRALANLFGNNLVQVGTASNRDSISISQETANALASMSRIGDGPQTIHVLNPDNTIQQIQIVYANLPT